MIQLREDVELPAAPAPNLTRVFLIDDDETFCAVVRSALRKHGYDVLSCGQPAKALELFTRQCSSLPVVLLDYHLPGLDGAATLAHLRKLNPRVKVILCSGVDDLRIRVLMNQLPLDAYIHKPFRLAETLDTLRRVLAA